MKLATAMLAAVMSDSAVHGQVVHGWAKFRRDARAFMDVLDDYGFDIGHYHISVFNAAKMVLVVVAMFMIARLGSRIARHLFSRMTSLDSAQQVLGEKLVSLAVWVFAFLLGIDLLGISLTALTVFSGAFGLAIGFGLQKTFGNLIAGIILLMDRSIKPGDVIAVNDGKGSSFGQVRKIGIRAVSVATRDNREYLIPNENLMTSQVENWSYSSREVSIQIPVGIAYGSDIDLAERLMLEAARGANRVLADRPPGVLLSAFGPNSIDMVIVCWIGDPEEGVGNVRSEVLKRVWHLFRENGIEIPYPQQDVSLKDSEGLRRLADALAARHEARDQPEPAGQDD
ncbi:mechanosensitive ion channel family protein [Novosphingobium sp. EMRT-2]|uniref:mechanosensitive ion channel family protein n=1 Tax=Novosphingobium sp. EMRT-2 TaxID=2571749 RepID=UPI0026C16FBC